MTDNERLVKAAMPIARAIRTSDEIRRAQRVDMAIGNDGKVRNDARPFVRLRSPDGAIWRVKVSNTGAVTATKETA